MTVSRAVLLLVVLAIASAGLLAVASRTSATVREADAGTDAADPAAGAAFEDDDIARHGAYRGPAYLSVLLSTVLQVVALVVLARVLVPRALERVGDWPGGWVSKAVMATFLIVITVALVTLPLSFVRTLGMDHAWRLSTQGAPSWLADQARTLGVALVTAAVPAVAFLGLVRFFPRTWWLWGWATFSLLTIVFAFLWPILVAPLFNRFTPLEQGRLRDRVVALAEDAGVPLDDVLVADASKRTTAENAYVAGLGASRRMVIYDTLLTAGSEDETAYVAAHELGHEVHDHIWKSVGLTSASLVAAFAALWWLAQREDLWSWSGATGVGDPRALPLLALFTVLGGLLFLPVQNGVSRTFERQADRVAIELTGDPDTAVRVYRRLAFSNLADLRPPRLAVWTLFSHPPIPERIRNVLDAGGAG